MAVGTAQVQASSLAGVFAALLGLIAVAIAAYAPRYHQPGAGSALYLACYNLALVACLAVFAAANVVTFCVAWESVALLCYLLILRNPRRGEVAPAACHVSSCVMVEGPATNRGAAANGPCLVR